MKISAPAVTQLTDRMVRKQLIERRQMDGDRRSVQVVLTNRGRRVVDRFRDRRNEIFCDALDRLSAKPSPVVVALERRLLRLNEEAQASQSLWAILLKPPQEQPEL